METFAQSLTDFSSLAPNESALLAASCTQLNGQNIDLRDSQYVEDSLPFEMGKESLEAEFEKLVKTWKSEKSATSFTSNMAMHPAYQRIIGMGPTALPWILRELEKKVDHWFWALKAISGQDPVPPEMRGKVSAMRTAWLEWGRKSGYVW